jgi:hypothetical protein
MTFEDRVRSLEPLGFTPRQTRFIATVALHSGYCLRRQYGAFAGVRYGKNVCDFLETLVERQLADRFTQRPDRGLIYHLQARAIYRALGQDENRNRRDASAALIARKVMVLDYVLGHPELDWLATEADKVELFAERFDVPRADLPQQVFTASQPERPGTTRYFTHKLPLTVAGDPPVAYFVYLVTDATGRGLAQFLDDHARLFGWLPAWTVVAVSASPVALESCDAVFGRHLQQPRRAVASTVEDLRWFFTTRQAIDQGELARLSVAAIDRFRTLREQFSAATFDALYAEWRQHGDVAFATSPPFAGRSAMHSVGRLVTDVLKFDYSQFGSLPGVA